MCTRRCFGDEKVQKVCLFYPWNLNKLLSSHAKEREGKEAEKHLSLERAQRSRKREILFERFSLHFKGEFLASEEKEKKETKTHHYRTQHHHKEYNIKMVFATKLQINAVFKKAAPAKKKVAPAKKVRF
jgi:hypothetical protein